MGDVLGVPEESWFLVQGDDGVDWGKRSAKKWTSGSKLLVYGASQSGPRGDILGHIRQGNLPSQALDSDEAGIPVALLRCRDRKGGGRKVCWIFPGVSAFALLITQKCCDGTCTVIACDTFRFHPLLSLRLQLTSTPSPPALVLISLMYHAFDQPACKRGWCW